MAYLLDANVFIQAKNLHYGFDFCPAFWEWIDETHQRGEVLSVKAVREELLGGDDDLAEWARRRPRSFFVRPDEAVVESLRQVSSWAEGADYDAAAVSTCFQMADYFLVGQAHAHGHVVVIHETVSNSRKRIKIPDACSGVGVCDV